MIISLPYKYIIQQRCKENKSGCYENEFKTKFFELNDNLS